MNAIVKYGLLTFAVAAIALLLGVLAGKYAAEASTGFAGNLRDAMYENCLLYTSKCRWCSISPASDSGCSSDSPAG